jgi:hypothetical protein
MILSTQGVRRRPEAKLFQGEADVRVVLSAWLVALFERLRSNGESFEVSRPQAPLRGVSEIRRLFRTSERPLY